MPIPSPERSLSADAARRLGLKAQGFGRPTSSVRGEVGTRSLNGLIDQLGLLQIDSVNVFERSHYLPVFARLGAYERPLLDRVTLVPRARNIEYIAHEAAFVSRDDWPLFAPRRAEMRARHGSRLDADEGRLARWLLDLLRAEGPTAASEIEHERTVRTGPWWGWSEVKRTLELLFRFGDVVVAGRTRFERRYALPEHVLPEQALDRDVDEADAVRELVRRSLVRLGVGTLSDIADYYRLKSAPTLTALRRLRDEGLAHPVTVRGWERTGGRGARSAATWLADGVRVPRQITASALLSPFDPVVWRRERALRMFGLDYRIEIYTPAPKRVYGYYVLPVLQDDRIVARVDLKSDRKAGVLLVQSAWKEPGADAETPGRLAGLLVSAAQWQGLSAVQVKDHGTLATSLKAAVNRL